MVNPPNPASVTDDTTSAKAAPDLPSAAKGASTNRSRAATASPTTVDSDDRSWSASIRP